MAKIFTKKLIIGSGFSALSMLAALIDKNNKDISIVYGDHVENINSRKKYFYSRHFSRFAKHFYSYIKINKLLIGKKLSIFGMIKKGGLSHIWGRKFEIPNNEILIKNNVYKNSDFIQTKINQLLDIKDFQNNKSNNTIIEIFKPNYVNPLNKINYLAKKYKIKCIKKGYIDELKFDETKKKYLLKLILNKKKIDIETNELYLATDVISSIKLLKDFIISKEIPIYHHQMFHGFTIFLNSFKTLKKYNKYFYKYKNIFGGTIIYPDSDFFKLINNLFIKFFFKFLKFTKIKFLIFNLFYQNSQNDIFIKKNKDKFKIYDKNINNLKTDLKIKKTFLKEFKKIHKTKSFNYIKKAPNGSDFHYWTNLENFLLKSEKHKLKNIYTGNVNIKSSPIYPTYTIAYNSYYSAYYKKNICS